MAEFHNPFHFVPLSSPGSVASAETRASTTGFRRGELGEHSHARYDAARLSGRIAVMLETEAPLVVGGERHADPEEVDPSKVDAFERDGRPMIPASTLKGLVSAVLEAASQSSMRVLEDATLSARKPVSGALSAIGIVVGRGRRLLADETDQAGKAGDDLEIIPLALPSRTVFGEHATEDGCRRYETRGEQKARLDYGVYADLLADAPVLPVYFGNYGSAGREPRTRGSAWPGDWARYMSVDALRWSDDGRTIAPCGSLHFKTSKHRQIDRTSAVTLVSQNARDISAQPVHVPGEGMVRGIVRRLGVSRGRRENMPRTKRHEIFIPVPDSVDERPRVLIPGAVLTTFHALADERTATQVKKRRDERRQSRGKQVPPDELLPYHLIDSRDGAERGDGVRYRLREGDLVFFDAVRDGAGGFRATEISLSAIWRSPLGSVHDYVAREFLPFHSARETLSLAEQLFGFVESGGERDDDGRDHLALAGRVRFSDAVLLDGGSSPSASEEAVVLKVLGTPKPPSPALYFRPKRHGDASLSAGYVAKGDLRANRHEAWGRKFYLHPPDDCPVDDLARAPFRSRTARGAGVSMADNKRRDHLKSRVTPVRTGCRFWFTLDFENVTPLQLGFLLYAIEPGDGLEPIRSRFRHRLGMGKSIGLGAVRLDIAWFGQIDRIHRYAETPFESGRRFHRVWQSPRFAEDGERAQQALVCAEHLAELRRQHDDQAACAKKTLDEAFKEAVATIPAETRRYLETIGDPAAARRPVHYPVTTQQLDAFVRSMAAGGATAGAESEAETFKWSVANDGPRGRRQALGTIDHCGELPTLQTYDEAPGEGGRGGPGRGQRGDQRPRGRPPGPRRAGRR